MCWYHTDNRAAPPVALHQQPSERSIQSATVKKTCSCTKPQVDRSARSGGWPGYNRDQTDWRGITSPSAGCCTSSAQCNRAHSSCSLQLTWHAQGMDALVARRQALARSQRGRAGHHLFPLEGSISLDGCRGRRGQAPGTHCVIFGAGPVGACLCVMQRS